MQEGAFALIDCLGWKGIWRREKPELLIKKVRNIEKFVQTQLSENSALFFILAPPASLTCGLLKPHIRFLSDSVAISLKYNIPKNKKLGELEKAYLVNALCYVVNKVLYLFIQDEPALVMRGCITYGEHLCKGNFLIGPAVDEAAEGERIAEGAFVWLHPTADPSYKKFLDIRQEQISKMPAMPVLPESVKIEGFGNPSLSGVRYALRNMSNSPISL